MASELALAATYTREVRAGIDRIWENVLDWEHLPALHEIYFTRAALIEIGDRGWRVELTRAPGTADRRLLLELQIDREKARYCVRVLAGEGTGTEIWTLLEPLGPHRTAIEVRFFVPEHRPERLTALGEKYRASYARLWDQDEAMMMRREALSARPTARSAGSGKPMSLGPLSELRPRLPLLVEFDGEPFRILELADGALVAHSTICPHWLGPLEEAVPENGILRCPWHGHLFDLRTGASADGCGYRLAPAPRVDIDPSTGKVTLSGRGSGPPCQDCASTETSAVDRRWTSRP
jgi:nitrite reductase/ring-hydroxylating ferredoxin subunit